MTGATLRAVIGPVIAVARLPDRGRLADRPVPAGTKRGLGEESREALLAAGQRKLPWSLLWSVGRWPVIPRLLPGQELWVKRREYAELIAPRVTQDPELESVLCLVIPSRGTERLKAADFGLDVIGLQVEVHALFGGLLVASFLHEDPDLGVRETEPADDVADLLGHGFAGGVECR